MSALDLSGLRAALCGEFTDAVELHHDVDSVVVVLPTTDIYGDCLSLVIESDSDGYLLTDHGATFRLIGELTGIRSSEAAIWRRVDEIALRHGVDFENGEFLVDAADTPLLARGILRLSAAIVEAMYLGRVVAPGPAGVRFDEEVGLFFRDHEIEFLVDQQIKGSSKAPHKVDFVLPNEKSVVAQAVASEQSMRRTLNIFYDLTEQSDDFIPVAFVDDEKRGYSNTTFTQLSYKANVYTWSERERFVDYWYRAHSKH